MIYDCCPYVFLLGSWSHVLKLAGATQSPTPFYKLDIVKVILIPHALS